MKKLLLLLVTHAAAVFAGFAMGIYALPILTAPAAPTNAEVEDAIVQGAYRGEFRRDLAGSDFLHWGEGALAVGPDNIVLMGRLAPGPDYRLYLSPVFVEDEGEFESVKEQSVEVGFVRTFNNFMVPIPPDVDPARYNTVVVWCESFGEFITAAEYRPN